MHQQGNKETETGDDGRGPDHAATPLRRNRMKMICQGKSNQQRNDEPAIVQSNRYAGNASEFDLCPHRSGKRSLPELAGDYSSPRLEPSACNRMSDAPPELTSPKAATALRPKDGVFLIKCPGNREQTRCQVLLYPPILGLNLGSIFPGALCRGPCRVRINNGYRFVGQANLHCETDLALCS